MGKKRTFYKKQEIPFFINKLLGIVNDQQNKSIISWSQSGNEICILNESELVKKVLPQHFKHHNLASFVRQLNLYGFHKTENTSQYSHQNFKRQAPQQLKLIQRIIKQRKKKQSNTIKRRLKEKKQTLSTEQQLQKLTLQNQKLRQQNKILIKNKRQRENILKKLRRLAKVSKKQIQQLEMKQNRQKGQEFNQIQVKYMNQFQNPSTFQMQLQNKKKESAVEKQSCYEEARKKDYQFNQRNYQSSENSIEALCSMQQDENSLLNSYLS